MHTWMVWVISQPFQTWSAELQVNPAYETGKISLGGFAVRS